MRAIRAATRRAASTSTGRRCSVPTTAGHASAVGQRSVCVSTTQPAAPDRRVGRDLQFLPETNDAIEIGAKYNGRGIDLNVAVFHAAVQELPAEHVQRPQLHRREHQQLQSRSRRRRHRQRAAHRRLHRRHARGRQGHAASRSRRSPARCATCTVNAGVTYAERRYRDNLVGAGGKPLIQRALPASGPPDFQRAAMDDHRVARLDPADRRQRDARAHLYRWPLHEQVQHRFRPRHREDAEGVSRW